MTMEKFHCGSLDWSVYAKGVGMPLVFLHAFPLDHTMYSLACLPLEDAYRVILPDFPDLERPGSWGLAFGTGHDERVCRRPGPAPR